MRVPLYQHLHYALPSLLSPLYYEGERLHICQSIASIGTTSRVVKRIDLRLSTKSNRLSIVKTLDDGDCARSKWGFLT
jgi:hypothetical protein